INRKKTLRRSDGSDRRRGVHLDPGVRVANCQATVCSLASIPARYERQRTAPAEVKGQAMAPTGDYPMKRLPLILSSIAVAMLAGCATESRVTSAPAPVAAAPAVVAAPVVAAPVAAPVAAAPVAGVASAAVPPRARLGRLGANL